MSNLLRFDLVGEERLSGVFKPSSCPIDRCIYEFDIIDHNRICANSLRQQVGEVVEVQVKAEPTGFWRIYAQL